MSDYKKENDPFFNLKHIGYCMAFMPPDGVESDYQDFISYCKYQLCYFTRTLFHDPIWDTYSDESLISEYYAMIFKENKEEKAKFETALGLEDDFAEWADKKIAENREELELKALEQQDVLTFDPSEIG